MHIVKYFYTKLYGDTGAVAYICKVQKFLEDLYVYYGGTFVSGETASSSSRVEVHKSYWHGFNEWYDESHDSSVQQSELEVYLNEPKLPHDEDFDVLKWWSVNDKRLPVLQKIARDILAIPATTVSSESAFSLGGRIIDEERSNLGSPAVEALVTANDWLPSIGKIVRQRMPMIGDEVLDLESEDDGTYETQS